MAHTVYIRGIPGNAQVTEVRVHVTAGLNTDVPFRIPIGGTAICTAVQVDPANDTFQGQTYKWFNLTFPDGRTGWVRDDLLDLQGDFSALGYGNYENRTYAFSAGAPAPAARAQPATQPTVTVSLTPAPARPAQLTVTVYTNQ